MGLVGAYTRAVKPRAAGIPSYNCEPINLTLLKYYKFIIFIQ